MLFEPMDDSVRIAVIDSGIDPRLASVSPQRGVGIRVEANRAVFDRRWHDEIGHGTALASAIRARAPTASNHPVRIFTTKLIAPVTAFIAAIDWAVEHEMHLACMSVPVTKLKGRDSFVAVAGRAIAAGTVVVSAAEVFGQPSLPGCLPGVVAVRAGEGGDFTVANDVVSAPSSMGALPLNRRLVPAADALAVANVTGKLADESRDDGRWDEASCLEYFRIVAQE